MPAQSQKTSEVNNNGDDEEQNGNESSDATEDDDDDDNEFIACYDYILSWMLALLLFVTYTLVIIYKLTM